MAEYVAEYVAKYALGILSTKKCLIFFDERQQKEIVCVHFQTDYGIKNHAKNKISGGDFVENATKRKKKSGICYM